MTDWQLRLGDNSRHSRRGESGLTLIEIIFTIAIIALLIVGLAAGLAQTEHTASISQDQAQLEVAMRQAADYVRDSSSKGLAYKVCADVNANPYALAAALTPPTGLYWYVSNVNESKPNSYKRNGSSTGLTPLTGGVCSASQWDYGVQEISVTVCDSAISSCPAGSRSLTRVVWKSWA